jgi:hypothetical protein
MHTAILSIGTLGSKPYTQSSLVQLDQEALHHLLLLHPTTLLSVLLHHHPPTSHGTVLERPSTMTLPVLDLPHLHRFLHRNQVLLIKETSPSAVVSSPFHSINYHSHPSSPDRIFSQRVCVFSPPSRAPMCIIIRLFHLPASLTRH